MKKITKSSPITLVELPATQFGTLNGEPCVDDYTSQRMPARALPFLHGIFEAEGFTDVEQINPVYNCDNGELSEENWRRILGSDIVGISAITRTARQSYELVDRISQVDNEIWRFGGGFHFTFLPDEALNHFHIVARRQAENIVPPLMNRLISNPNSLEDIEGIGINLNGEKIITKNRTRLTPEEMSRAPFPIYDDETQKEMLVMPVFSSVGCNNHCEFCSVVPFYGSHQTKSIEYVIEGLRRTKGMGKFRFWADDNFIGNPDYTIELLERVADEWLQMGSSAQVTVEVADNERLLKALKGAGVSTLFIGFEYLFSDKNEGSWGKPYTPQQNRDAIKYLKERGFYIHGMFVIGGDEDTPELLKATSYFANRNVDSAQFCPPVPIPGSRLYKEMEEEGRILTKDWSLYGGKHVLIRPKNFTPEQLQLGLTNAYESFWSFGSFARRLPNMAHKATSAYFLYLAKSGMLNGMLHDKQSQRHLEFLKSIS